MGRSLSLRSHVKLGLEILAVAAAYCAAAQLGHIQQFGPGEVRMIWPAAGVALAALLVLGADVWPGILVGSFLADESLGVAFLTSVLISVGITLGVLFSYWLLREVGFRIQLDRLRDALALVFLGAFLGMLVTSTIQTALMVATGAVANGKFLMEWLIGWTSSAVGVLVVTPALVVLWQARRPARHLDRNRLLEAAALLACTILIMLVAARSSTELLFLASPCLIWAATRFGLPGAATFEIIVATIATYAAANMLGPFAGSSFTSNLITIQAFNGATALTALFLAVTIAQLHKTQSRLEDTSARLAEALNQLNRALQPRPARPRENRR
jgi:integral membrane sensor domain MASE1